MIAALRYEWVRISTVRSTKIMLVLALVFGAGIGYLASSPPQVYDDAGNLIGQGTPDWWGALAFPLVITAVLASVVAAQSIGQEYRFGLVRLTLTAFPQRPRILAAKLVMVVGACVVIGLASYLGSWFALVLRGYPTPPQPQDPSDPTFLLRGLVFLVLWGLAAFAIAGVTRQTALGIAVPIISGLIVEQLLSAFLSDSERFRSLIHVLPFSTAARWSSLDPSGSVGSDGSVDVSVYPPSAWAAIAIFAVWVAVFLAVEVLAFLRRDA